MRKTILWSALIGFSLFSGYATWQVGYFGIWQAGIASLGAWQILIDLSIACLIVCSWMIGDARQRGIRAWPWIVATILLGSMALLSYLLCREYGKACDEKRGDRAGSGHEALLQNPRA